MVFETARWVRSLSGLKTDKWGRFSIPFVVGPRDACFVEEFQRKLEPHLLLGEPVETDLFILAAGEPERRLATKIGGLPYWRSDRSWPTSTFGAPIPFLAQFDLSESRDLIGDVPWDVVLLFSASDVRQGAAVDFQNKCEANLLIRESDVPVPATIPRYSCEREDDDGFGVYYVVVTANGSLALRFSNL
jgi:Domain of unknown function (DUF1963)